MYRRTSGFLVKEKALLGQKLSSVSHRLRPPQDSPGRHTGRDALVCGDHRCQAQAFNVAQWSERPEGEESCESHFILTVMAIPTQLKSTIGPLGLGCGHRCFGPYCRLSAALCLASESAQATDLSSPPRCELSFYPSLTGRLAGSADYYLGDIPGAATGAYTGHFRPQRASRSWMDRRPIATCSTIR